MGQYPFKIMRHLKCFYCSKSIVIADNYFMFPLEVPYGNLFFHKECFSIANVNGNIVQYLNQNPQMLYNYLKR